MVFPDLKKPEFLRKKLYDLAGIAVLGNFQCKGITLLDSLAHLTIIRRSRSLPDFSAGQHRVPAALQHDMQKVEAELLSEAV